MVDLQQIKEQDVFLFSLPQNKSMLFFEGILIVQKRADNKLIFQDTFWGIGDKRNVTFTKQEMEQMLSEGASLKFYFNLNDVEPITKYDAEEDYSDNDVVCITSQYGLFKNYFKFKNAEPSSEKRFIFKYKKMLEFLDNIKTNVCLLEAILDDMKRLPQYNSSIVDYVKKQLKEILEKIDYQ